MSVPSPTRTVGPSSSIPTLRAHLAGLRAQLESAALDPASFQPGATDAVRAEAWTRLNARVTQAQAWLDAKSAAIREQRVAQAEGLSGYNEQRRLRAEALRYPLNTLSYLRHIMLTTLDAQRVRAKTHTEQSGPPITDADWDAYLDALRSIANEVNRAIMAFEQRAYPDPQPDSQEEHES